MDENAPKGTIHWMGLDAFDSDVVYASFSNSTYEYILAFHSYKETNLDNSEFVLPSTIDCTSNRERRKRKIPFDVGKIVANYL